MIEIKNLNKKYSDLSVYENFSLSIKRGEITCVLGESGTGKTTLLNVLANLVDYEGEITKEKVSYVFQKPNLFPNMTVEENLKLVCSDLDKIVEILTKMNLSEKLKAYPNHLSGGEAQRVAVARALLYNSPLILMDEPFSSLDIKTKTLLTKVIMEHYKKHKNTFLIVTHDLKEAVSLSNRIVIIKDNKIAYDVTEVGENTEKELYEFFLND